MMPHLRKKVRTVLRRADKPAAQPARDAKRNIKTSKSHKTLIAAVLSMVMLSVGWWFYLEGPTPTAVDVSQGKVISVEKEGPWVKTVVKLDGNVRRVDVTAPITPVINAAPITTSVAPITVNATPATTSIVNDKPITTPIANDIPVAVAAARPAVVTTPAVVVAKPKKKSAPVVSFKAQGYTIQIAGGTDLTSVQKTVCQLWAREAKSHCAGLPSNLHYVRTLKNDQDWYIATIGQYNSSAEARMQLQQLPTAVQKNTPWVRAFTQIPNLTVVASK
jgi:septal ring-binding cell division protein DamX